MGTDWSWKKMLMVILLLLAGIWFVIDPYNWWPVVGVGEPCDPISETPRCTGRINFF